MRKGTVSSEIINYNSDKPAFHIEETCQKKIILNSQITIYDTETYPNLNKVRLLLDSLHQVMISLLIESGNIFKITLVSTSKTPFSMQHLTVAENG